MRKFAGNAKVFIILLALVVGGIAIYAVVTAAIFLMVPILAIGALWFLAKVINYKDDDDDTKPP